MKLFFQCTCKCPVIHFVVFLSHVFFCLTMTSIVWVINISQAKVFDFLIYNLKTEQKFVKYS